MASALGVAPDRLSKMVSGDTKKLAGSASGLELVKRLAAHLDTIGMLAARGLDKATFVAKMDSADDLDFIQLIAQSRTLPIPRGVISTPRRNAEHLIRKIGGLCFLYRLGTEVVQEKVKGSRADVLIRHLPVLRRIPVAIEDSGQTFLLYKDSYSLYGRDPEVFNASGYAFLISDNITIIAEDIEAAGISELFMMQLSLNAVQEPTDNTGRAYPGVAVMHGDTSVPTACKVLLRHAPRDLQVAFEKCADDSSWQALARTLERKVYLSDNESDDRLGVEDVRDQLAQVEADRREAFTKLPYGWYADYLQLKRYSVDVQI